MLEMMLGVAKKTTPPAAGGVGYYSGGFNDYSGAYNGATHKYTFTTDVITNATAMVVARYQIGGCGNTVYGMWGGGWSSAGSAQNFVDKYTIATDGIAATSSLSVARRGVVGFGSDIYGYFAGGTNGTVMSTNDRFLYGSGARSSGTSLGAARWAAHAAGTTTMAIIAGGDTGTGGNPSGFTDKYTFSADTRINGTALTIAREDYAAAGNMTDGYFLHSTGTTVYQYASDVQAPATALSVPANQQFGAACGNNTQGVFASASYQKVKTEKYTYATSAIANGTSLPGGTAELKTRTAAFCSTPGGFAGS